jgi:hypothetical protein
MISVEQHIIDEILAENAERTRRLKADFDPITGENAPGERRPLVIKDFPIPVQYVPVEMLEDPFVRKLQACVSIKKYLKTTDDFDECDDRPSVEDLVMLVFRIRFAEDFAFWAYYEIRIEDKVTGMMVPFKLNGPQIIVLLECEKMRRAGVPINIIICKARQWGGSTFCIFYQMWIGLFCAVKHSFAVCAQTKSVAGNITKMLMRAMETYDSWSLGLPIGEKLQIVRDMNSGEYVIKDSHSNQVSRSTIRIGSVEAPDALRGYSGEGAHFSETGVWKDTPEKRPADLVRSIAGGILMQANSMQAIESTPKGAGNFFHQEYMRAKNGKSAYKAIFISWMQIPHDTIPIDDPVAFIIWLYSHKDEDTTNGDWLDTGRYYWSLWEQGATLEGINWYRHQRKTVDDHADMASEAPCNDIEAFKFSGTTVFNEQDVVRLREGCRPPTYRGDLYGRGAKGADSLKNIRFIDNPSGLLKVWAKPDKSVKVLHRYLVAVDVGGRSKKADWSVIRVFDRAPMMYGGKPILVAEQRYHTDHDLLAYDAARIARWYDNALLVIESNTLETRDQERDVDGNMTEYILDIIADLYDNLYARKQSAEQIKEGAPTKWGFHTNTATKPMIIGHLVGCVRDMLWVEQDEYCCTELALYQKNEKGQFGAPPGEGMHDDVLMCTAIALWVCFCDMELPKIAVKKAPVKKDIDANSASHF